MTLSASIRRVMAIAVTTLALGFGAFTAVPAHADTLESDTSPAGLGYACGWNAETTAAFVPGGMVMGSGYNAIIDVGNLSMTPGAQLTCNWTNGLSTKLTLQGDGNFVFYNYTDGVTWGARTTAAENKQGPGTKAVFQSDANLLVRNAAGTAIWATNTHTYPDAFLAFQSDGNLVIYNHIDTATGPAYPVLWAAGTE